MAADRGIAEVGRLIGWSVPDAPPHRDASPEIMSFTQDSAVQSVEEGQRWLFVTR
jgi:hypothetical protein